MINLITFLRDIYPAPAQCLHGDSDESSNPLPGDYAELKDGDEIIEELPCELIIIAKEIARLKSSEVIEAYRGGRVMAKSPEQHSIDRMLMRQVQRSIRELRQLFDVLNKSHVESCLRVGVPADHCIKIMFDPKRDTLVYVLITVAQAINHSYGSGCGELVVSH